MRKRIVRTGLIIGGVLVAVAVSGAIIGSTPGVTHLTFRVLRAAEAGEDQGGVGS